MQVHANALLEYSQMTEDRLKRLGILNKNDRTKLRQWARASTYPHNRHVADFQDAHNVIRKGVTPHFCVSGVQVLMRWNGKFHRPALQHMLKHFGIAATKIKYTHDNT